MYTRALGTVEGGIATPPSNTGIGPLSQIGPPPPPPQEEKKPGWKSALDAFLGSLAQGAANQSGAVPVPQAQRPGLPSWVLPAAVAAGVLGIVIYTRR
jgi:hypothetical protein